MPDPNDLKNLSSQLKKTIIFAESFKGGSSVDPSKNILNIQKTTIGLAGHVIQLVSIVSDLAKIVNNNSKKITSLKNTSKSQSSRISGKNIGAKLPGSSTSNVENSITKITDDLKKLNIKVIDIEKIVNNNSKKITSLKNISKSQSSRISGKNIGAKLPGSSTSNVEDNISKITKSVISIAEILSGQKKLKDSSTSYDRRKAEQEKRNLAESKLEKRFDGLKKAAEKILAPVKSLLDKIINFLVTVFLGRVVYKLLEWFGDPKNADKVRAIGRFLGDHWPKLLALYLTFGTSVGRFALGLTRIVAKGAIKLLAKILLLTKAKKLSAAGRFLGGRGGNVAGAVLGTAAAVTGAYALTQGMKGDDEEPKTLKPEEPKIPGYAGGGIIKIPKFAGGGLNFKGMFGGALGSSPEKPQEMPNGFVSGEKGVDKVPAMLSDGEFVMSVGAVQKYGVDTLEGMNAAGGGTNKPKIMGGKTYAAGGGMMGGKNSTMPNTKSSKLSPIELKFASRAKQRGITDPTELKAFLAQVKHESGGNFGDPQREKYNSSPNDPPGKPGYEYFKGYANIDGLGNRNTDDAYKYIGRGYLQVTGRANYEDIGKRIGKDLIRTPNLLMDKDIALDASIEYWKSKVRPNVNNWNNTFQVSKAVNKPAAVSPDEITGMSDREDAFRKYSSIPNKTFTDLKKDVAVKPVIKKEPSLIERLGSIFSPRPATAGEPGAKQKSTLKPKPMDKGGFLDVLGKILPNTGTVMAPRTSGAADVRGNRQTEPAYQNKLLGIPLGSPSSKFSEGGFRGMRSPLGPGGDVGGYSEKEMKRYADRKYGASFSPTSYAGSTFMDQHLRFPGLPSLQTKGIPDYMMPSTPVSKPQQKSKGIVKDATDISTIMSNVSREKIRQANRISPGSATEITYGQSQRMLAEQLGTSNRAEQIKKLKQQGLLPSFSSTNSSGSGSKQKTLGLTR